MKVDLGQTSISLLPLLQQELGFEQYGGFLKTKNRTTMTQWFLSCVHIQKKPKNTNAKRYMNPKIHSSIIYNCQNMEAT